MRAHRKLLNNYGSCVGPLQYGIISGVNCPPCDLFTLSYSSPPLMPSLLSGILQL